MALNPRFRGLRSLRLGRCDGRREVLNLVARPTHALRRVRRKTEAGRVVSRAEWTMVAHIAQHGMEPVAMKNPDHVSTDSLIAVLDAFSAVYDVRTVPDSRRDAYYLGNLPVQCRPASVIDETPVSTVRTAVAETRHLLRQRAPHCFLWLAGRNLAVLLAEDPLPGAAVIHRALRPHWAALWRLAVRGHDALTDEPLQEVPAPVPDALVSDERSL